MFKLAFTKASSESNNDNGTENAQSSTPPQNSLRSMGQRMSDGWSDEEDEAAEDRTNTSNNPEWLQPGAQQHLNTYGVGAKLLMKMGYESGKGLGAKKDGIVNPIQTKLRPQGLGVGGIKEKVDSQADYMDVSSEDEAEVKKVMAKRIRLFNLIEELEVKGVDVPRKVKQISDSKAIPYDEIVDIIEKLQYVNDEWDTVTRNEKFMIFQMKDLQAEINREERQMQDLDRLKQLVDKITDTRSVDAVTNILEELIELKIPQVHLTFVNVCSEAVEELFVAPDYDPESRFSHVLSTWASLYRQLNSAEPPLNAWDSLLWKHIRTHISSHEDNVIMLQYWVNMPIISDIKSLICIKIVDEILEHIEPSEGPSKEVIRYLDVLPHHSDNLLDIFEKSYKDHLNAVDLSGNSSLWGGDELLPLLQEYTDTWSGVFERVLGVHTVKNFEQTLTKSWCCFTYDRPGFRKEDYEFGYKLYEMGLASMEVVLLVFQFNLLNPLVLDFSNTIQSQPQRAVSSFQECYQWFKVRSYGDLSHCIEWYVNVMVKIMEGDKIDLPTLYHKTQPSLQEMVSYLQTGQLALNVDGIPTYQIKTTFKDVVEQKCLENDIVFSTTKEFHPEIGIPLYRMKRSSGRSVTCYIQDDVLWVDRGRFTPISVLKLSEEI